jgi:putative membrane protein
MVLPGISGSLVLIVCGVYFDVITAITQVKALEISAILYLCVFAAGMLVGLVLFARLVNWLLRRFHDATMTFLIGLMAGSLYALWPFKRYVVMDTYTKTGTGIRVVHDAIVYTNQNVLPDTVSTAAVAVACALAGALIMAVFMRVGAHTTASH